MNLRERHLNRAEKNIELSRIIVEQLEDFYGWAVTVLYYSAVQYVDAYRLQVNDSSYHNPENFGGYERARSRLVRRNLPSIADHFFKLRTESRRARYEPEDVFTADDVERLRQTEFEPIRQTIYSLLQSPT